MATVAWQAAQLPKEARMAVKVTLRDNGPYVVEGEIEIVSQSGQPIANRGARNALCRCGGSTSKPFCDGTHSRIGFDAAEAAVSKEEGGS
jgi:CDGSH-type Zn-finger protein